METFRNQLRDYAWVRADYARLSKYLRGRFASIAQSLDLYPLITSRAKSLESFADKCSRMNEGQRKYVDPLKEIRDLCGIRIIVHTLDDVEKLVAKLENSPEFEIKESQDTLHRLDHKSFGYRSKHLELTPCARYLNNEPGGADLVNDVRSFLGRSPVPVVAEVQVRTIVQHTWADVYHELGYKNEFKLPAQWERSFAQVAADLERIDERLLEIKQGMRLATSSWFEATLKEQELAELAERLNVVVEVQAEVDRTDPALHQTLHRLVRVYRIIEGGEKLLPILLKKYEDLLSEYEPAERDLGAAYIQINRECSSPEFKRGVELLEHAVEQSREDDIDALCSLAGARRRQNCRKEALDLYYKAHLIDPADPYPLGNYIAEELLKGNRGVLKPVAGVVRSAIERCRKQVAGGVNLPWALFDLGLFHLYMEKPQHALLYYAQGVAVAPRAWMKQSALSVLDALAKIPLQLEGLEWARKLLNLRLYYDTPDTHEGRAEAQQFFSQEDDNGPKVTLLSGSYQLIKNSKVEKALQTMVDSRQQLLFAGPKDAIGLAVKVSSPPPPKNALEVWAPEALYSEFEKSLGTFHPTIGSEFSPEEPLALWHSLLHDKSVPPTAVTVFGCGGDELAACHYAIALAFGARVGVLGDIKSRYAEFRGDAWWPEHLLGMGPQHLEPESVESFLTP